MTNHLTGQESLTGKYDLEGKESVEGKNELERQKSSVENKLGSSKDLLVEIGAEEIPAGYIVPALEAFKDSLLKSMDKFRIEHGEAQIFGTPRRLAVIVNDVSDTQKAQTATLIGPPASAGFDKEGLPTIAAYKFAEKAGVSIEEIKIVETEKGNYLSAVKQERCESTATILESDLPELILSIPFPKSMRWGDLAISFARPIISILALFGETPLKFSIGTSTPLSKNIESSDFVFGHQFMYPGKFKIPSASDYKKVLKDAGVIVDIQERKALLREKIEAVAKENDSTILQDEELIDIVTNLVEYPWPVLGRFDEKFLEVPDEALITAMREHQKYFSLTDKNTDLTDKRGALQPCFIAVNNTCTKDMGVVAKGHEKVLRARLSDAQFFYKVDLESTMDQFAEKLKKVTFQAQLGSMFEKRERLVKLVSYIVDLLNPENDKESNNAAHKEKSGKVDYTVLKENVIRAAQICKADLVSQMVIEFTKLQGVIGRVYAEKGGENKEVANAVEQHYKPVHSGGELPDNMTGKIVSIADKIDTICGCFSIDLVPTGASDPYALRRQSIGIIQIMIASNFTFSLKRLVEKSVSLYLSDVQKQAEPEKDKVVTDNVLGFIKARMSNMLVDQGNSKEAVASALSVGFDNLPDTLLRIKALDVLRQAPDFEPLSAAFKRVVNILKKSEVSQNKTDENRVGVQRLEVDQSLFLSDAEHSLYSASKKLSERVQGFIAKEDYDSALKDIASLRPEVDSFFDDVMVMVEDKAVKNNRIALLSTVASIFQNIADFSQI
ncbi:MAG: glycine--tRNA ligase subunit beta [Desulfamplus sp.]|nr:glycine--tRNA ligase subunit beta [Desulfamplus sp.]